MKQLLSGLAQMTFASILFRIRPYPPTPPPPLGIWLSQRLIKLVISPAERRERETIRKTRKREGGCGGRQGQVSVCIMTVNIASVNYTQPADSYPSSSSDFPRPLHDIHALVCGQPLTSFFIFQRKPKGLSLSLSPDHNLILGLSHANF